MSTQKQESSLPLTDPRDAEAQRMRNIPYRNASYGNQTVYSTRGLAAEYRSRRNSFSTNISLYLRNGAI